VTRFSTWLFGLGFVLLGLVFCLWAGPLLEQSGVAFTKVDALPGLRAVYAGLHLAIGFSIVTCAACRLYAIGLLNATLAVTGLAIVRAVGMIVEHAATATQWVLLAPEIAGVIAGIVLLVPRLPELQSLARSSSPRSSG
jgi:hypothetical protein